MNWDLLRLLEFLLIFVFSGFAFLAYRAYRYWQQQAAKAQDDAHELIARERAQMEAEVAQSQLQHREEALRERSRADEESRELRQAIARLEERARRQEEDLAARQASLAEFEERLQAKAEELEDQRARLAEETLRLSHLSEEEAKALVIQRLESEFLEVARESIRHQEEELYSKHQEEARRLLLQTMERCTAEYLTEATVAVVPLPSDDMKGRLIGREGRNIRSFEQVTGVDLIIDDTPEAVVISSFDPVRRETARLALMNLMVDGRIHPGRIEELYEAARAEVQRTIQEAGERAAERAGVSGLPHKVIEQMGRLRFRASFAQNVLDHSVEVALLAAMLASELGLNGELARRAGFLHDIGKGLGDEWEGPHALVGMEFLQTCGLKGSVLNAVGAHHREIEPETAEAMVVIVADAMSASRPGARRENLENFIRRLKELEAIAASFPGVDRVFALSAGREVRVLVRPNEVDDLGAIRLAKALTQRIEAEFDYSGQIKVTVIRETRAQEIAK